MSIAEGTIIERLDKPSAYFGKVSFTVFVGDPDLSS